MKGGCVRVYDLTGTEIKEIKSLEQNLPVECLAVSPNNTFIVSGGVERVLKVYEINKKFKLNTITSSPHTGTIRMLEYSNDGRGMYSGSDDYSVKVWRVGYEVEGWRCVRNFCGDEGVLCMSVSR